MTFKSPFRLPCTGMEIGPRPRQALSDYELLVHLVGLSWGRRIRKAGAGCGLCYSRGPYRIGDKWYLWPICHAAGGIAAFAQILTFLVWV